MANIENFINRERLLNTFQKLVSIDSESYHERKIADFLIRFLQDLNLQVQEDDAAQKLAEVYRKSTGKTGDPSGNLWFCMPGNLESEKDNREKAILLSSHMDTVRPGIGKKAIIHEDGTITSDGSSVLGADDAAGIAEILELLTILSENQIPHPDIEVLLAAAEEPYCQGSRYFDFQKFHAKTAYILDLSGAVGGAAFAAPSILSLYIRVKGKSAHAGFSPESGIHAIYIASQAIASLPYGHVEPDTTINLGTISGGAGKNIVPEEVYLTGEIRSMSQEKAAYWLKRISDAFQEAARKAGGTAEVVCEKEFDAYRIDQEEPVVQNFLKAANNLNLPVQLVETFGGSDNNHFNSNGIRGIVLANAMNNVHTTQEYSHVKELVRSVALLLEIVQVVSEKKDY